MATPAAPDPARTVLPEPGDRPAGPNRSAAARGSVDKRTIVLSAVLLFAAIVGGVLLVTIVSDDPAQRAPIGSSPDEVARPESIPQPGTGTAPRNSGDRGGWEQLALFGLLFVAMGGIGFMVFRGGRRAKAGRDAWYAAAATGRDGAVAGKGRDGP